MSGRSAHTELGKLGEELAAKYLEEQGFIVLARNWAFGKAEIDIIAKESDRLVFIEVKTRNNEYYGNPEDAVSKKKQKQLARAAQVYIEDHDHSGEVRYDIVSIILNQYRQEIYHIRDAFYPVF